MGIRAWQCESHGAFGRTPIGGTFFDLEAPHMGIGIGILLIAIGAILAFAVDAEVSGIDVQTIGIILVVVGILGVILDLVLFAPRRRTTVTETVATPSAPVAA